LVIIISFAYIVCYLLGMISDSDWTHVLQQESNIKTSLAANCDFITIICFRLWENL
jgi:hypothetical protein